MGITNLPRPGYKFKIALGPGSFERKFKNLVKYGKYKNLGDNREAIFNEVRKNQRAIKIRGGLTRIEIRDALKRINKSTPKPTYADKYEMKELLKYLGRGGAARAKGPAAAGKSVKASDGKSYLTEEQVKKNLKYAQRERIDESGVMGRGATYSKQYAGGEVKSRGVMGDIGIDIEKRAGKIGFAADYKKSKLPDNPASKTPSAGIRPIGL